MNIKCPNCRTAYVVPDSKVGDKPKKMRCSRCSEVFTVKRRSNKTPLGYQEFTGAQEALPKEFAFLRATDNGQKKDVSMPPMAMPTPAPPPIPEKANPAAEASKSDFEDFKSHVDGEKTQPGFGEDAFRIETMLSNGQSAASANGIPMARPTPPPESPSEPPLPLIAAQAPPSSAAAASPPPHQSQQPPPTPARATPPEVGPGQGAPPPAPTAAPSPTTPVPAATADIYGAASWETEAPLDLGNYALPSEKSQRIGKIMAIFTGVVIFLFLFVIYRNGWSLSLSKLPDELAFAFSGGERELLPDEVNDLETTLSEQRILTHGAKTYLVVSGTVFNNAPVKRSDIILRAKLYDSSGELRAKTEAPCNKILEDTAIKRTPRGQIRRHYIKKGTPINCAINGESSTLYQLIFETPPADYNQSFKIEVTPIFAR